MQSPAKYNARPWKIALLLLVGVFLTGMAATLVIAERRVSRVVDADYYKNGLHYDQTRLGTKNAGLGWTMSASLAAGDLQVEVKDQAGAPLSGGGLRFQPDERPSAGPASAFALTESAPGVFRAPRPASSTGEVHGTLRFTRGEATASQKVVLFN